MVLTSSLLILAASALAAANPGAATAREFDVRAHGAAGDGVTLDTAALQKAIDVCAAAGGGKVVFPEGRYLTGSLELKSGVHLVVKPEAVIVGSRSLADYPSRRLIQAKAATDVAITGGGAIDGQGEAFWEKRGPYEGPAYRGTAAFEYRALPRPSFLYFHGCRDVVLKEITLRNSPSWTVHFQRCQRVRVEKVTIRNPLHGPNTDGIDINSSVDVLVKDCDIVTGDDGVVLKSTEPGHDHPSRNITVEGCRIWSACNALKIGTETHDCFENIVFRDCHLYSDSDNPLERALSGVAIESVDGARLSGINVTDITMRNVRAPIFVRLGHRGGNSERTRQVEPRVPGKIEKVVIRNVTAERSMFESSITGIPGHDVEDIALENVRLEYEGGGSEDWALGEVPDEAVIRRYPEAQMFGRLPAYGLYCRHVAGIRLRDVRVSCLAPDPRPMLVCDDVKDLLVEKVHAASALPRFPLVWLKNVRNALVSECVAPSGTGVFVAAEGDEEAVRSVQLEGNDTRTAATALARLKPGELISAALPLVQETSPGLVVIEAEAMRCFEPMAVQADSDASSGQYVSVPVRGMRDSGGAACRFEVSTAGDYVIWARTFGESGETNSFYASIDRGPAWLADLEKLGRWHWGRVRNREDERPATLVSCRLDRGVHTLEIRNRESGTKIDAVVIVRADVKLDPERDLVGDG